MSRKPKSPEGMMVAATTREEPPPRPEPTDTLACVEERGWKARFACGHRAPRKFKIDFFGDARAPSDRLLKKRLRCGPCEAQRLKKIVARCALCGSAILPGDGVAVYADDPEYKEAWKTRVGSDKKGVLGCLFTDCCPTGGFFGGHWTEDGYKPAYKHGSAMAEAMATGKAVIGNA